MFDFVEQCCCFFVLCLVELLFCQRIQCVDVVCDIGQVGVGMCLCVIGDWEYEGGDEGDDQCVGLGDMY